MERNDTDGLTVGTLTKQQRDGQALEQYAYDSKVIDNAVMLGDMKQMDGATTTLKRGVSGAIF